MGALGFLKEVQTELLKVFWPKPREIGVVVLTVGVVVCISSLFFLCIDYVVYKIIEQFLNFGG